MPEEKWESGVANASEAAGSLVYFWNGGQANPEANERQQVSQTIAAERLFPKNKFFWLKPSNAKK